MIKITPAEPQSDCAYLSPVTGPDRIVWGHHNGDLLYANRCRTCRGLGIIWIIVHRRKLGPIKQSQQCTKCRALGWKGINPKQPTIAPPGTVEKSAVMQVRYHSGHDLWNELDAQMGSSKYQEVRFTQLEKHLNNVAPYPEPQRDDDDDY